MQPTAKAVGGASHIENGAPDGAKEEPSHALKDHAARSSKPSRTPANPRSKIYPEPNRFGAPRSD